MYDGFGIEIVVPVWDGLRFSIRINFKMGLA